MYKANSHKELKELIKENKFPILITDEKIIRTVQWMEHKKQPKSVGIIAEPTIIIGLAVITMITVLGLYALYKDKNIEVEMTPDGKMVLRTK